MANCYKSAVLVVLFVVCRAGADNCTGISRPADAHDPFADAAVLRDAMEAPGDDGKAIIIDVVTGRSLSQRIAIVRAYKSRYNADLADEIRGIFAGRLAKLLVVLMTPLRKYYAQELYQAALGKKIDDKAIIEILCSTSRDRVRQIMITYEKLYGKSFERRLRGDTSVYLKRLLDSRTRLISADESQEQALSDAENLFTGESQFNTILLTRSYSQLGEIFLEYKKISGRDIEAAINETFSGSFEECLVAIVKCVASTGRFLSERLRANRPGSETNDRTFIRIVATRCENDIGDVKEAFEELSGKSLESWINETTSGWYRRALISLVTPLERQTS